MSRKSRPREGAFTASSLLLLSLALLVGSALMLFVSVSDRLAGRLAEPGTIPQPDPKQYCLAPTQIVASGTLQDIDNRNVVYVIPDPTGTGQGGGYARGVRPRGQPQGGWG